MNQDFTVTPWDVSGKIDYKKLIEEFGTEPIDEDILGRWQRITGRSRSRCAARFSSLTAT